MPKLPIPSLEESLERYLLSVRPLVNDNEYNETAAAVADFAEKQGPDLQIELEELNRTKYKDSSFISEPWSVPLCLAPGNI